jgi:glyoxylase-like metal-dependent hydrolase (beta-lactamase superfamily II)
MLLQQAAKPAPGPDPIKLTKLAENVYLLTGSGGNIAVVTGKDGTLLIDDGLPGRGKDILDGVATVSKQPPKWLINTHWHYDHTGNNEFMGQQGMEIIANQNCRERLSKDTVIEAFSRNFAALPPVGLPKKTFDREYTVPMGKEETLHLTHVDPAHTDGDIFIHFQNANVLHTGDLLFNGSYPFIDYSTKGWIGGMVAAQEKILALVDAQTKIIPGHGPMATRDDVKASHDMMATVSDRISDSIKAGHSVEETVAAKPTKDLDAKWAKVFMNPDMFTTIVYKGIVAHQKG